MAYECDLCGKKSIFGHNVSHSSQRTKRKFKPNLRTVRVMTDKGTRKMRLCTKCLKSTKLVEK